MAFFSATAERLFFLQVALCVAILLSPTSTYAASVTGYDITVTFPNFEEAREAAERYDASDSGFQLTNVRNTTVSLYTTSYTLASSLMKRSNPAVIRNVEADYTGYYTYETMTAKLQQWSVAYPNLFRLFSLGTSIENRQLWAVEISTTPDDQTQMKPNVKYIGNMHGDEVVGRELLMRFLDRLLTDPSSEVQNFVASTNTFVVPTMNPDGFARGTRGNRNGVDLNRNFPDQYRGPSAMEQRETALMKAFIASRQWSLSANFHGGDLVVNYPWDGRPDAIFSRENKSPDDDLFKMISKKYAKSNSGMMNNPQFPEGITNGAAWYVLYGGMQDYNYIHYGCPEITLEVSMDKWPAGRQLDQFWQQNKKSMLDYLNLVHTGVRGTVYDAQTGQPLPGANVTITGREITKVKTRQENGAYFRVLPPGVWNVTYSAPGFRPTSIMVTTPAESKRGDADQKLYTVTDVFLVRAPVVPSAPTTNPPIPPVTPPPPRPQPTPIAPPTQPPTSSAPQSRAKTFVSTSAAWVVPMFGLVGIFAAVLVTLLFIFFGPRIGLVETILGTPQTTPAPLPSA